MQRPFIDHAAQHTRNRPALEEIVLNIFDGSKYVTGPEVTQLEMQFAETCGDTH